MVKEEVKSLNGGKMTKKEIFWGVFDVLFVLILCFVVLLTTMFIQRNQPVVGANGYEIGIISLSIVIISVVCYFFFLVKRSKGELKEIVDRVYGSEKKVEEQE